MQSLTRKGCPGFQCYDGTCIENDQQCDGARDCSSGEDEEDCSAGRLTRLFLNI